jgi:two-component system nitrate/nitrite response regulator NarL
MANGMEFLNRAKAQGFAGKVLVVTAGVAREQAAELIRAGVSGIFVKQNSAASLAQGIRNAIAGKVWFEQDVLQGAMESAAPGYRPDVKQLTAREQKVLSAVLEGMSNKQIAGLIKASESSVKATLQQLFSKTGVRTRSQLVRVALERYKDLL